MGSRMWLLARWRLMGSRMWLLAPPWRKDMRHLDHSMFLNMLNVPRNVSCKRIGHIELSHDHLNKPHCVVRKWQWCCQRYRHIQSAEVCGKVLAEPMPQLPRPKQRNASNSLLLQ